LKASLMIEHEEHLKNVATPQASLERKAISMKT
jgi:hypothetical protein